MPKSQTDDTGKRISEAGGESSVRTGEERGGFMEATTQPWRTVLMLQVSGSSKAWPPSSVASTPTFISLESAPSGSSLCLLWHSVPTSIIHCGRCVQGQEGVARETVNSPPRRHLCHTPSLGRLSTCPRALHASCPSHILIRNLGLLSSL